MRAFARLSALSVAVLIVISGAALADFLYTATLKTTSRIQGKVIASGITWVCQGSACTTSGPWPVPGVSACAALAQQVGEITAYGYPGNQLSAADLATCNKGVAAPQLQLKVPVILTQPKSGAQPPAPKPAPSQQQPQPQPQQQAKTPPAPAGTAASGPFVPKTVRTETLRITGTGALPRTDFGPFTPQSLRTTTLTITGTGEFPRTDFGTFSPKAVRTDPLTITGTGSL
jgi:hypothetical protein